MKGSTLDGILNAFHIGAAALAFAILSNIKWY